MKKPIKKTPKKPSQNKVAKRPTKSSSKKKIVPKALAGNKADADLTSKLLQEKTKLKKAKEQVAALKAENERLTNKLDKMGNSDLELVEYFRAKYQAAELARLELIVEVKKFRDLAQEISNFRSNEREELLKKAQEAANKYQLQCNEMAEEIKRLKSALKQQ